HAMDAFGNLYWQTGAKIFRVNYGTMEVVQSATLASIDDIMLGGDPFNGTGLLDIRMSAGGANNVVRVIDPFNRISATGAALGEDIIKPIMQACEYAPGEIDVSDLAGMVEDGYVISSLGSARSAIEPLL